MYDILVIFLAKYLFLLIIVFSVVVLFFEDYYRRKLIIKLSLLAFPFTFIISKVMAHFVNDSRPFVADHVSSLIVHAPDNGFPSDHVLLTMTIAAVFFVYNRRLGSVLAVLAVIIGVARVLARVHHSLDVFGSVVIAVIATCGAWLLLEKIAPSDSKIKW